MKFCAHCGSPVERLVPAGDNRLRHVCPACGCIHYQNPRLVVGTLPVWGDQVLLCRRAIEPRHGYWTLPAGFMENGESAADGALRETMEEACARVRLIAPYTLVSVPHIDQIHLLFRAELADLEFAPGTESLEVRLFAEQEIPWKELAFSSVSLTLQTFFEERRHGQFGVHHFSLDALPRS
ncbi:MAG: NUDIX hydrolase [Gammaproteobacteria bacterium]|jgi:ADP-ribose pyrophosphatase YjhB (NUDIX family)|nr:NUDIX hydrolase [Gammaproteobacteria bacterium]MBU0770680.1 NUDIX hydrolase [Gammaproteobacteria bacterium]MBU0857554.1 NUDIX hydrolase [Gammaproteobacteria bacterium]MBU1848702.1 NUDIX hydrolase [Gammaproteobacteria bacterium]